MLTVYTRIDRSIIHGLGCFADQYIKRGSVVWHFDPKIDNKIPSWMTVNMPEAARNFVWNAGYVNPENDRYIVLCGDNARFLNFEEEPSLYLGGKIEGENALIASRHLVPGDELTVGFDSDADAGRKLGRKDI